MTSDDFWETEGSIDDQRNTQSTRDRQEHASSDVESAKLRVRKE